MNRKKYVFQPLDSDRSEIRSLCLGRGSTLRAPALKLGDRFLIGCNEEMYTACLA